MKVAEERPFFWKPEAIALAEREGVDVSLLTESMQMTLAERFEANDGALELVLTLEEGRKKGAIKSHRAPSEDCSRRR